MCIVIIKHAGVEMPTKRQIKTCFNNNPHGAGFMYAYNGNVYIEKGFMSFKSLWRAVMHFDESTPMVIHFRLATHGSISAGNTHPFPLSSDISELKALSHETDMGLAHNGMLDFNEDVLHDLSDTMVFIRDILSQPVIKANLDNATILHLLTSVTEGSKIAILSGDGNITLLGDEFSWITEQNGLMFSNTGYIRERFYDVWLDDYKDTFPVTDNTPEYAKTNLNWRDYYKSSDFYPEPF